MGSKSSCEDVRCATSDALELTRTSSQSIETSRNTAHITCGHCLYLLAARAIPSAFRYSRHRFFDAQCASKLLF